MVQQPAKRKRADGSFAPDGHDDSGRPSPYRPGDQVSARHDNSPGSYYGNQNDGQHHYQGGQRAHYGMHSRQSTDGYRRGGYRGARGGMSVDHATSSYPTDRNAKFGPISHQRSSVPMPEPAKLTIEPHSEVETSFRTSMPIPSQHTMLGSNTPPMAAVMEPAAAREILPFQYEYITDHRRKSWEESGREEFLYAAHQVCLAVDEIALGALFLEILRAALDDMISSEQAVSALKSIISTSAAQSEIDVTTVFLDTLSVLPADESCHPAIKTVVLGSGIPAEVMRQQLDESLLLSLGLIRSTFNKVYIRKQTNILYRQSNYNLLREESEGYSKLVTELFTTVNGGYPSEEVVVETFETIKALIGAFDLDAGRVLDVTLDVFASVLVKHYRFFVKFLVISTWWPQDDGECGRKLQSLPLWARPGQSAWINNDEDRLKLENFKHARDVWFWNRARAVGIEAFFEFVGSPRLDEASVQEMLQRISDTGDDDRKATETRNWIKTTHTLPPGGNSIAAQLLGFKLRFYASEARDPSDNLPINLIYLAALLIKIGFISLRDLYMHLYPTDESMGAVKERQMKEKEERDLARRPGGGALNALARAGALADDTVPVSAPVGAATRLREAETRAPTPDKAEADTSNLDPSSQKSDDDNKAPLPEALDQKVQLLRSLLCIGAISEALYMLGRFPWLVDAFPDLPEHIHRICHHALSKVYEPLNPLQSRGSVKESARRTSLDQSGLPKGSIRFVDGTPPKVLRWAQLDKNDTNDGVDYRFYYDDWSDAVPVCQNVDDVFTLCDTLLKYSGFKIGQDPELLSKLARIGKHSLSTDSSPGNSDRWIELCKRLLCPALSLMKSNPAVVNEMYDILKSFSTKTRYDIYAEWFTGTTSRTQDIAVAFDIVTLETKDTLRRINKTNQKPMARALAKIACASPGIVFATVLNQVEAYENLTDVVVECGRYFTYMGYDVLTWSIMNALGKTGRSHRSADGINTNKWLTSLSTFCGKIFKRYAHMQSLPVVQYVLNQLQLGNSADLRVLREIILAMAGIAIDTDFSESQVQAMAGGPLLQTQTLQQVQDKRHELKTSAKRLMRCLNERDLTGSLLVAIAQERQKSQYNIDAVSLKVISENFDEIHNVLIQYVEMLRSGLSVEDFNNVVPDVVALVSDFGLDASIAFTIQRQSIAQAVEDYDVAKNAKKRRRSGNDKADDKVDVDIMDSLPKVEVAENEISEASPVLRQEEVARQQAGDDGGRREDPSSLNKSTAQWHPMMQELMDRLRAVLPADFEADMSLPFYVTFWQLSLHDMTAPSSSYDEEIKRQKDRITAITNDRSDLTSAALKKKEQEKKSITELLEGLRGEMVAHIHSYKHVRSRLQIEKDMWFKAYSGNALNVALLQTCFLPRCMISPLDSFYTQKMLFFLHSSGAPNFRTVQVFDRVLHEKTIANLIFNCTSREVDNLGRFLNEILKELTSWHADKAVYERKAWGVKKDLPGFACNPRIGADGKPEQLLLFEDFRRLFFKWHKNLFSALKTCLNNGEYMHIKNAVVLLKCIHRSYPAVNFMGKGLTEILGDIVKAEKGVRNDLFVAANSLKGMVGAREKEWVMPQAFHFNAKSDGTAKGTQNSTTTVPVLNVIKELDGTNSGPIDIKIDVEDGELEDAIMTGTQPEDNTTRPSKKQGNVKPSEALAIPAASTASEAVNKSTTETTLKSDVHDRDRDIANRRIPQKPDLKRQEAVTHTSERPTHSLPDRPAEILPDIRTKRYEISALPNAPAPSERTSSDHRLVSDHDRPSRHQEMAGQQHVMQSDVVRDRSTPRETLGSAQPQMLNEYGSQSDRSYRRSDGRTNRGDSGHTEIRYDATQSNVNAASARPTSLSSSTANAGSVEQNPIVSRDRAALIEEEDTAHRSNHGRRLDELMGAERSYARLDGRARNDARTISGSIGQGEFSGRSQEYGSARTAGQDTRRPARADNRDIASTNGRSMHSSRPDFQDPVLRHVEDERVIDGRVHERRMDRSDYSRHMHEAARPPKYHDENYGRLKDDTASFDLTPEVVVNGRQANRRHERDVEYERPVSQGHKLNLEYDASAGRRSGPGSKTGSRHQSPSRIAAASTNAQLNSNVIPGVHPDRLKDLMIPAKQPAPSRGSLQADYGSLSTSPATPSGPRSAQHRSYETNVPTSRPLASSYETPTGPHSDRRHEQRRVGGMQDVSQHASQMNAPSGHMPQSYPKERHADQGASIRGRASAAGSAPERVPPVGRSELPAASANSHTEREDGRRAGLVELPPHVRSQVVHGNGYDSRGRREEDHAQEKERHPINRQPENLDGVNLQRDRPTRLASTVIESGARHNSGSRPDDRSQRDIARRNRGDFNNTSTPRLDDRGRDRGVAHDSRNGLNNAGQGRFPPQPRHNDPAQRLQIDIRGQQRVFDGRGGYSGQDRRTNSVSGAADNRDATKREWPGDPGGGGYDFRDMKRSRRDGQ